MSAWEVRQWFESLIPAWSIAAVCAVMIVWFCIDLWRGRDRRPR